MATRHHSALVTHSVLLVLLFGFAVLLARIPMFARLPKTNIGSAQATDTQPPESPGNLTVTPLGSTSARMRWVVPSDNIGVTRYDIRYRVNGLAMELKHWVLATVVAAPPAPGAVGSAQEYVLSGLVPATDYAIGVAACDAAGNCSTIPLTLFRTFTRDIGGNTGGPIPQGTGSVTGRVVKLDGGPVPFQSSLSLRYLSNNAVRETVTDTSGNYKFENLGAGGYDIVISGISEQGYSYGAKSMPVPLTVDAQAVQQNFEIYLSTNFMVPLPATTVPPPPSPSPAAPPPSAPSAPSSPPAASAPSEGQPPAGVASPSAAPSVPAGDTQPPDPPTTFSVLSTDIEHWGGVRFRWSIPADNVGVTRFRHRRKIGTTPMTEADWTTAQHFGNDDDFSSLRVGESTSYVFGGFEPNTDYVVGMKACDAAGNCSSIISATFKTSGTGAAPSPSAPAAGGGGGSGGGGGGGGGGGAVTSTPVIPSPLNATIFPTPGTTPSVPVAVDVPPPARELLAPPQVPSVFVPTPTQAEIRSDEEKLRTLGAFITELEQLILKARAELVNWRSEFRKIQTKKLLEKKKRTKSPTKKSR